MGTRNDKRQRMTGRGGKRPFVQIFHSVIDTPQFGALKGQNLKLLIDLARQYNGKNNGDLSPALCKRWKSADMRSRAINELQEFGWITKTKQGGLGLGPDLYAITWWPIDSCAQGFQAEREASNLWASKLPRESLRKTPNKKTPVRLTELVVPLNGAGKIKSGQKVSKPVPLNGAKKAFSKVA